MPRNPDQNAQIRETRGKQILDAALNAYIIYGFHGCEMDIIAKEALLAKGLLYYYYKTKNDLFAELFTIMFDRGTIISEALIKESEEFEPVKQLMYYAYGMFGVNQSDPRIMQFFLRAPFDAASVFSPGKWMHLSIQSRVHNESIMKIIERGIASGIIPKTNIKSAASSFWSVFVANLFDYSKLIIGEQEATQNIDAVFEDIIRFCFQGLGIKYDVWFPCMKKIINQINNGESQYEII